MEPSIEMLKIAKQYSDRIISLNMSASEFIRNEYSTKNNVFLFKEVIHHISNLDSFFKQLKLLIADGRRALIITRPTMKGFPFFEDALNILNFEAENFINKLKLIIVNSGLNVSINSEIFIHKMNKEIFIDMVRRRVWSTLHKFNDVQIQTGIQEIQKKHLEESIFKIPDYFLFINLSK